MPKLITSFMLFFIMYGCCSCNSSKNISGTYRSKFALSGFFTTRIRLMPDSSMQYIFQGDLLYDSAIGTYKTSGNHLYINFDNELSGIQNLSARLGTLPLKTAVSSGDTVTYQMSYRIGHKKLFPVHTETGKKINSGRKYNKRKKYIIFGGHYYSRRYYLKRTG